MADFVNNLLGTSLSDGVALAVLAAMALLAVLIIWLLLKALRQPGFVGRRGKQARIAITDAARIDDRRRLVLVRRDDVEHLVLIGGANDLLVESDIRRVAPARERIEVPSKTATPSAAPEPAPTIKIAQTPEPVKVDPLKPAPRPEPIAATAPASAATPVSMKPSAPAIDPAANPTPPKPVAKPDDGGDLDSLLKGFGATRD